MAVAQIPSITVEENHLFLPLVLQHIGRLKELQLSRDQRRNEMVFYSCSNLSLNVNSYFRHNFLDAREDVGVALGNVDSDNVREIHRVAGIEVFGI